MKKLTLALAVLAAIGGQASAATFANDSGAVRTIGSTFVGLVETDSGHKEVTHIITDAGVNPDGTTWFAYAGPLVSHNDMRGHNDK